MPHFEIGRRALVCGLVAAGASPSRLAVAEVEQDAFARLAGEWLALMARLKFGEDDPVTGDRLYERVIAIETKMVDCPPVTAAGALAGLQILADELKSNPSDCAHWNALASSILSGVEAILAGENDGRGLRRQHASEVRP